jgi:hypothetical protein
MGLRFQRRIRIAPGLRLNLSKSGVGLSVGRKGAWLTVGPRGARATAGLPGTGVSWTEQISGSNPTPARRKAFTIVVWVVVGLMALGWLISHG